MLKPQCHWPIDDWLGLLDPPRGEDCVSGERRGPTAPGEDNFPSPGQKSFHISTSPNTRRRKPDLSGRYRPARCGNPSPTGRLLIGWGSSCQRVARVAPRIYAAVPPHLGRISSHPWVRNPSLSLQRQIPGDVKADFPGGYRPTGRETHSLIADWRGLLKPGGGEG